MTKRRTARGVLVVLIQSCHGLVSNMASSEAVKSLVALIIAYGRYTVVVDRTLSHLGLLRDANLAVYPSYALDEYHDICGFC
jgi:hypothetical protein